MIIFSNFHKANLETSNVRNWVLWDDPLGLERVTILCASILHLAPEVENPYSRHITMGWGYVLSFEWLRTVKRLMCLKIGK
jgi:hypothetical protein